MIRLYLGIQLDTYFKTKTKKMINSGREWDWMDNLIKNEKEMSKDNRKEIKVDHPEFGHVIFHGATARQIEVLESLKANCAIANDVIAQNKMLADMIKDKDVYRDQLIKEIEKLKSDGETPYVDELN
jgi:hypothetical protein